MDAAGKVIATMPQSIFGGDLEVLANTLPPGKHVGYAVQWFGLAATVLVVAGVLTWRARGRRGAGR